ncbi:MAG: FAD-dependent oxidoreductase [Clostridiales bacterium]|nr:FAD-dependent oxidoreductase [Clostridiales bacterium]
MNKKSILAPFKGWKYLFKKPVAIPMDDIFKNPRESQDNYRGFHINDWETCIGCGTCAEICPTNAITMVERSDVEDVEGSKPERPVIDYGRCCFCGLCVDICTSGSLNLTKEYLYNSSEPEDYLHMPTSEGITGKEYKLGYIQDETSDLLDLERKHMEHVGAEKRKSSFIEIVRGFSKEQALAESARCVDCGICTKTCPANMNIPEYIKSVWEGNLEEGLDYLYKTNPLPSVCGRICTHECESVCALSHRGDAIAIRWLKRYIVDNMPDDKYEEIVLSQVSKKGEGKVAIVGAGSSGLSAAYYLATLGYEVDVYERKPMAGGPMRYGAPKYRLPDAVTDHDISFIEKLGVKIHTNTDVGKDITLDELKKTHNAVFVSTGYPDTRALKIPGVDHKDVKMAMSFLAAATEYERGVAAMPDIKEDVVVVGSGDVAFDVARTLIRFQNEKYGKMNVQMLALETAQQVPATPEEVTEGVEEGIHMNLGFGPQTIQIDKESGDIKGIEACECIRLFDDNNRFDPQMDFDAKMCLETQQVYLAIGQVSDLSYIPKELQDKITIERGKIKVDAEGQVDGASWLFAGGDIVHGMDIINGVADGHRAAVGIDKYISKNKK